MSSGRGRDELVKVTPVVVGPIQTNCYIAQGDSGDAIVVDPGGDGRRVLEAIAAANAIPRAVFNTHGHWDHIGANDVVAHDFHVPVYIHRADAHMLTAPGSANPLFASMEMRAGTAPVVRLEDQGHYAFGDLQVRVLHTPGHTQGGVCLLLSSGDDEPRDLITGDTLFAGSVGRSDLPGGSEEQLMASIKDKLLALPDDTRIYPGHGESSTLADEKMNNPFVMLLLKEGTG